MRSVDEAQVTMDVEQAEDTLTVWFRGRLDAHTTGKVWDAALRAVRQHGGEKVVVEAGDVNYCDGSGVALLLALERLQLTRNRKLELRGLAREFRHLLDQFDPTDLPEWKIPPAKPEHMLVEVGQGASRVWEGLETMISFLGEIVLKLAEALVRPFNARWKSTLLMAEKVGVNALPMIGLIAFLVGVVITLEATAALRKFGAASVSGQFLGVSLFKELGPLLTAVIVMGRTGSAFAAELGTMKVTEQINALSTLGLDPVRFLVVPRVMATVIVMPLLTVFFDTFALLGGAAVSMSVGQSVRSFAYQVIVAVSLSQVVGSVVKSLALGMLAASVGCMYGLQTKDDPSAVGDTATRAVVTGVIVIALADAFFAAVYFQVGI